MSSASAAEMIAEQAERGEYEIGGRNSGKNRSKNETTEHKHTGGGNPRKLVDNWQNNEKRQHRDSK